MVRSCLQTVRSKANKPSSLPLARRGGLPAAPVADVRDVAESPRTVALGILQRLDHPRIEELTLPREIVDALDDVSGD